MLLPYGRTRTEMKNSFGRISVALAVMKTSSGRPIRPARGWRLGRRTRLRPGKVAWRCNAPHWPR
jgi:hypothetical protein